MTNQINNQSNSLQHIFVVLGMARSGTSAIASGLNALGVDFGQHLLQPDATWNAKGFWEDTDIVYKINRNALLVLQEEGMRIQPLDAHDEVKLAGLKQAAQQLIRDRMQSLSQWGFKDPRTARLLPFWQPIFAELQLQEHYMIAVRNPLASAHSYQKVMGCDIEVGLLMWVMHLFNAIEGTHHKERLAVSYEIMLQQPREQLHRIKTFFQLAEVPAEKIDRYANEFLDKKLRHYQHDQQALLTHPAIAVVPICVKMYALLQAVTHDEMTFESAQFYAEWQAIKQAFELQYPQYQFMDMLLRRQKQMERKLRTIHKSWPWKMMYPLHVLDDKLRARRRARLAKRLENTHLTHVT